MGVHGEFDKLEALQSVGDPSDPYVLQKAALLALKNEEDYSETKDVRMTDDDPDHEKPDDSEKPAQDIPAEQQSVTDSIIENEENNN